MRHVIGDEHGRYRTRDLRSAGNVGTASVVRGVFVAALNELSCNPDHDKQPAGHRDHDGDQIAPRPPHWARCSSFERTRPPGDGDRQTALLVWAGRLGNAGA